MKNRYFSNKDISKMFRDIATTYNIKGGNYFKEIAYQNAAESIEHATSELKDLWDEGKLDTVPGLGESIRKHLDELFKTGRVKHFEALTKNLPAVLFELLKIRGMGPKTAYRLVTELKVKSMEELAQKAKAGKIRELPGFGEKSESDILTSLFDFKEPTRHLLVEAFPIAERVLKHLRNQKYCQRAEPLGSIRRMVATVGDVDIAVASNHPKEIIDHFLKFKEINKILESGTRKAAILLNNGMQIDLMVESPDGFGALLQHFTGSKNHNIHLREHALKKGISLSDYGITQKGKLNRFKSEKDFYGFLGMNWIAPEMREDTGEIEAALNHKLPRIVELKDIKGDLHLHSNYPIEPSHDLGENNFHEIVQKAIDLNYEYIGLSDHSPGFSTHTKNQIIKLIKARTANIEQIISSYREIRILNLLEIDILTNGELSVPVEGLKILDGSIAGIHSGHTQDKKTITKRLLSAINSQFVQIISHPTGRLIHTRESYDADWDLIFRECAKTQTILEINAWPNRMDLPDTLVKEAIKRKVKLIINSDSHAVDHMENMKFGVSVARRGWATKKDIVNTLPWLEFRKIFSI